MTQDPYSSAPPRPPPLHHPAASSQRGYPPVSYNPGPSSAAASRQPAPQNNYYYQQQQYPPVPPVPAAHQQQHLQQQQQQPPLPPVPQQQQHHIFHSQAQKPRPKSRSFSFRSDRSQKSHHSHQHETHAEKEAKRLHSKADPTLAMNEAEPSAVAAGVKSSLAPLRSITHKDTLGNPIAEPDRSNPTRSRWERPLDTIRSFEAAIDNAYTTRRSYVRADSDSAMTRPRSYYPPRFPQDSYYNDSRPTSFRPDSQVDPLTREPPRERQRQRDSYYDQQINNGPGQQQYPSNAYQPGTRQRMSRMQSEPGPSNSRPGESNVYPLPNNHRSYETVASAAGSGGSSGGEASGYQTDPTSGSENSSIDRNNSPAKREPVNDYGIAFSQLTFSGANGNASGQEGSSPYNNSQTGLGGPGNYAVQPPSQQQQRPQRQLSKNQPPMVPRKDMSIVRKPMSLSNPAVPPKQQTAVEPADKRKSWFSRKFSKSS